MASNLRKLIGQVFFPSRQREQEEEFVKLCQKNDLKRVEACLSQNVDVNAVSEDGRWSGLTIAAHKNYPELLEMLLSHPKIKINKTTDASSSLKDQRASLAGQWTALMFACQAGNSAIVSRLVQVPELDINYQDKYGNSAVVNKAKGENGTECLRILTETGKVDWNKRDRLGFTPLYWALYGNAESLEIILKQPNIDFNIKEKGGETLAHVAVSRGNVKLVETLAAEEKYQFWNTDKDGDTPVLLALKENKMEILEILLKCPRVDLNMNDNNGDSLIMVALKTDKLDVVKLLLQNPRVDLSTRDGQGSSLEKIAKEKELKEILDLIRS